MRGRFARLKTMGPGSALLPLPLTLRLALRDLRGGFTGFTIFLICIALGTGAVGAIEGLSAALQDAISREGKTLLGGDVEARLVHRRASDEERAFLASLGPMSEVATLRAMARKPDGGAQALADLKAVDGAYPLYGAVAMENGRSLAEAVQSQGGLAVDRTLLDQLQLGVGDSLTLGRASFRVTAIIEREPDRLAAGPAFGSRIILSFASLQKTGLAEPGSLVRWSYRSKTDRAMTASLLRDRLDAKFPEAGFFVRDSSNPSPGVNNTLKRLTEFLTLVGLTAMLTGGIGVANGVSSFVERRRKTIAAYKALGASQSTIFRILFTEIGLLAALGVLIGLAIAIAVPLLAAQLLHGLIPIEIEPRIYWRALGMAALFGVLCALPFVLWPLGRAQQVRAAELLRGGAENASALPPRAYRTASGVAMALLALAAVLLSAERRIAGLACIGLLAIFVLFFVMGGAIRRLASALPRPARAEIALALANIAGPASLARTIALSLGAGLTLLTAVSLVDASLTDELNARLPEQAPSYFFVGIPKQNLRAFEDLVRAHTPEAQIATAPMLRGRLVALRGQPVEQIKAPSTAEWVLTSDRGLTYSDDPPPGSRVAAGEWWPHDYEGEPLVSFEAGLAKEFDLKLGDTVTVNVLGRNISAKIANFREVRWGTLDLNFVMIFSPNALRRAPFSYLATLSAPAGRAPDPKAEGELLRSVTAAFPAVSAIRVRDILAAVSGVLEKIMRAVRLAGGVTLVMGALAVAGALVTAQARRIYEAAVLRVLGASRRRIVAAHLLEHLALVASLSIAASALGLLAAYLVVTLVMGLSFTLSSAALLQPSLIETIFVTALGVIGTFRVLSAKPAHYLRSE